jgi:hypothetical protein
MAEADYHVSCPELAVQLAADHVQGVFEERLPLGLHAALQLGCAAGGPASCLQLLRAGRLPALLLG